MKIDKYLIFALMFAAVNVGAIFVFFGAKAYSDSSEYLEVIDWLQGEREEVPAHRLLRPLGPIIAFPFEFLGEGTGLIIQNAVFYLLGALLIFKITDLIYDNPLDKLRVKKQALLASLFFVTATPALEVGLSYLVDVGGWFFYLLSIFLTLLYLQNKNDKLVILNGLLSGFGFLMKETGGLGILFFGLMILLNRDLNIKEKFLRIVYFGIFFMIPVAAVQILVFKYFHITSAALYSGNNPATDLGREGPLLVAFRFLGQFFRILGLLWPFILIGLWRELREKNWERIKIFLALIPSSFSFLLWSVGGGGRVVFIFAPLGILLATYGCKKIKPLIMALIVMIILAVNYFFVSVNQEIPFTDMLYSYIIGLDIR